MISVARDFSELPGGRFKKDGSDSGEAFRALLQKAFDAGGTVKVLLDGTRGYGASFLEEAFGGLVRLKCVPYDTVKANLVLETSKDYLEREIWTYIEEAKDEANAS